MSKLQSPPYVRANTAEISPTALEQKRKNDFQLHDAIRLMNPIHLFSSLKSLPFMGKMATALALAMVAIAGTATGQQEAQFTHYMFNTLAYNPGYAGSKEYLSAVAVYRDQWAATGGKVGWEGRPITQTLSVHSTFKKRVGLGLNIINGSAGAREATYLSGIYAYRINFGKGTLSVGLQGGVMNWRADWSQLDFQQPQEIDNAFKTPSPSLWLPDFGAGLFFYTPNFYAGASMPHLANFQLRQLTPAEQGEVRKWARVHRHFYLTTGGAIPIKGDDLVFRPSFLLKSVGLFNNFFRQGDIVREIGAPVAFDLDAALFFHRKLWVGTSFTSAFAAFNNTGPKQTSHTSVDFYSVFHLENGLRIGLAYDYPLGKLKTVATGSFELMLGYDFYREVDKAVHIRYF
ncbi:MAG: PorP/SprF family type IX secretion system membrane protein [Saprospiraceae bacterium]|nr:PorP/SprF family type IX secretion system membrane protein [Saprospiraceae bacterium]